MKKMNKKAKTKNKNIIDYKLAADVSKRVSIENVRLLHCNSYQKPEVGRGKQSISIDCNVKVEVNRKSHFIIVLPRFKLQGFSEESKSKEPSLLVEANFMLVYKANNLKGLSENNFNAFGNTNGIYNAWPYWREFVQNTIARMSLPPLTIPVFRLVPAKVKEKVNK